MKWILYLVLGGIFLVVAVFALFGFMLWNHERGYPKPILDEDMKGTCWVSKTPFVLVRSDAVEVHNRIYPLLPIPDGVGHVYSAHVLGEFLTEDGSEVVFVEDAIDVPVGTKFILKDGYQDRTLNKSNYLYWLAPEGIELDSLYVYHALALLTPHDEMKRFPDNDLFERACDP